MPSHTTLTQPTSPKAGDLKFQFGRSFLPSQLSGQIQISREDIIRIDWNTRNSRIPFPRWPPLGWNVRNGRENKVPLHWLLKEFCQMLLLPVEAFSSVFDMEFEPGAYHGWLGLAPNWPVRRRGRPITNCNHLPFSTSSSPLCTIICNASSSCPTVIKCLIDESTNCYISRPEVFFQVFNFCRGEWNKHNLCLHFTLKRRQVCYGISNGDSPYECSIWFGSILWEACPRKIGIEEGGHSGGMSCVGRRGKRTKSRGLEAEGHRPEFGLRRGPQTSDI